MKKVLAMVLCVLLAMGAMGAALADEETKLTVSGNGTVLIESDLAVISMGVREVAKDVLEAQASVNGKIASIREALLDAGVKEDQINTDAISIYANYDYSGSTEMVIGYTAYNSLSVRTTDIENVGKLIDAAFAAGANTLDNVQFTVQDDSKAQEQALTMAVEDARRKADVLAAAVGKSVASIQSLAETSVYTYDSMRNFGTAEMAMSDSAGAGTMVQAALIEVNANVTMELELR